MFGAGARGESYDSGDDFVPPWRRRREAAARKRRYILARKDTEDGPLEIMSPTDSLWYKMYVQNFHILEDDLLQSKFRMRFRLPYNAFLELAEKVKKDDRFARWCGPKYNNKRASPVKLLLLGSLRYLGRGWTFDDIEECTAVSADVHRCFLHKFIDFGSTALYDEYVLTPVNLPEARSNMREYTQAGFPGCVGSSDCTHIVTDRCQYNLKNNHLGGKSSLTTRTFNITCNHWRRILHSTQGGPGRWNDMTMVRLDRFVSGIQDGSILEDVTFELLGYDQNGKVVVMKYKGVYVIVDNGYLDWSCTVPPFGVTNDVDEIRWSRWVESMRKDVECTFGILKGRWRILKAGIRLYGVDVVDKVWLTCCALHNWLLDIDGLSKEWDGGVCISDWEGTLGELDFEGVDEGIPNVLARLSLNLDPRNYDSSGMGAGSDVVGEILVEKRGRLTWDNGDGDDDNVQSSRVWSVRHTSLSVFRRHLVEHFQIMYSRNEVVWPKK